MPMMNHTNRALVTLLRERIRGTQKEGPSECGWTMSNEFRARLGDTVRKRETKLGNQKLLDVWALHIGGLLYLLDADDLNTIGKVLYSCQYKVSTQHANIHTWMDRNRARCLAAMSWYRV